MANLLSAESCHRSSFLKKGWKYLDDNFHKFSEDKLLKVLIPLLGKDVPQDMGDIKPDTKVVIIRESNGHSSSEGNVSRPVSVIRV